MVSVHSASVFVSSDLITVCTLSPLFLFLPMEGWLLWHSSSDSVSLAFPRNFASARVATLLSSVRARRVVKRASSTPFRSNFAAAAPATWFWAATSAAAAALAVFSAARAATTRLEARLRHALRSRIAVGSSFLASPAPMVLFGKFSGSFVIVAAGAPEWGACIANTDSSSGL